MFSWAEYFWRGPCIHFFPGGECYGPMFTLQCSKTEKYRIDDFTYRLEDLRKPMLPSEFERTRLTMIIVLSSP